MDRKYINYFTPCNLKYLRRIVPQYYQRYIQLFYPEIHALECLLWIILMLLEDHRMLHAQTCFNCIVKTISLPVSLRVTIRCDTMEEKWVSRNMFRWFVVRCMEEQYGRTCDRYRMSCFLRLIAYLKDPKVRCVTFDRCFVTIEDKKIDFSVDWKGCKDGYDISSLVYFH